MLFIGSAVIVSAGILTEGGSFELFNSIKWAASAALKVVCRIRNAAKIWGLHFTGYHFTPI